MDKAVSLAQEAVSEEAASGWLSWAATPDGRIWLAAFLLVAGVFLLLPPRGRGRSFLLGAILTAVATGLFLIPTLANLPTAPAFFLLEGLAILGGLGTISSRNPVYSAIWFASALLAIGALLLMGSAQFLGLATVAVYAGAIVVTFLFVLMLAQPEGHAPYDRLGWGWFPTLTATLAGVCLAALVISGVAGGVAASEEASPKLREAIAEALATVEAGRPANPFEDPADAGEPEKMSERLSASLLLDARIGKDQYGAEALLVHLAPDHDLLTEGEAALASAIRAAAGNELDSSIRVAIAEKDTLSGQHVARLGAELFGRHLISVQVAGVLLLVALVGAIAMAVHGKNMPEANVMTQEKVTA